MTTLLPGKGLHGILNQDVLDFIEGAVADLKLVYSDELHDNKPSTVITQLCKGEVLSLSDTTLALGKWVEEEADKFAKRKASCRMPYRNGELRVNVVLTKQDELKLDIREWYDPNAARQ